MSGDVSLFALPTGESAGLSGQTISAIKLCANVSDQSGSGSANIKCRLNEGAYNSDTTGTASDSVSLTGYVMIAQVFDADPSKAMQWQLAGLDAIQIGVVNAANAKANCDYLGLMVDYTNSTGPTSFTGTDAVQRLIRLAPSPLP